MDTNDNIRAELRQPALDLRAMIPDVWRAHVDTSTSAMKEGELSSLVKELLALVISVTRECDGCIVAHARRGHGSCNFTEWRSRYGLGAEGATGL
jgi:alkylhydroperoxidase/carboxymuconolactone decarboxylase family protein YurZ